MIAIRHITHAEASLDLDRRVRDRFGDDPDVWDTMQVEVLPCPILKTELVGTGIVAWPKDEPVSRDNLLIGYYGPMPVTEPQQSNR